MHLTTLEELAGLLSGRCLICGELSQDEIGRLVKAADADVVVATPSMTMRRPACLAELAWERFERGESDDLSTCRPPICTHAKYMVSLTLLHDSPLTIRASYRVDRMQVSDLSQVMDIEEVAFPPPGPHLPIATS